MNRSAETAPVNSVLHPGEKNAEIMGKKIGTAAVPAIPKGSMESINFLGGPIGVTSDRYEYEKALCVQV